MGDIKHYTKKIAAQENHADEFETLEELRNSNLLEDMVVVQQFVLS